MSVFDSLKGTVRIELISADITTSLHTLNEMHIPIFDLQIEGEVSARFTIQQSCLKKIQTIALRKGEQINIISSKGIYQSFLRLKHRRTLVFGLLLLTTLTLFLPSRVLFVAVEGNQTVPSNMILEAAGDSGIGFFASRRLVRSEKMKNELLGALPQLQWAGVNTYGSTAVISVRERNSEMHQKTDYCVSRIVAACDGVITSCTVTRGTGVCGVGQAVQAGQLLVSGYTDCGGVIISGRASGEIYAQTRHEITAVSPAANEIRVRSENIRTFYSLCIGKKRINLYKGSGISDSSCVKMVLRYDLTLPGGYILPLALVKEQRVTYSLESNYIDESILVSGLSEFSIDLLNRSSVALTVIDMQENLYNADGVVTMNGLYNCTEMISVEQGEQIGDMYGKTD